MFTGWSKDFDEITYDMTVTAQYIVNDYSVAFETNGGSSVPSQKVKHDSSLNKPEDPTLKGYSFDGWYSDSGLSQAFDFNAKVTADTTLYAKWTETASTAQAVAQLLTLETAFQFAKGDTWECVTSSFVMLGNGDFDAQITWTSSNSELVHIKQNADGSATGVVTRPSNHDSSVVITATVTKGGETVFKTFLLVIKREGASKDETREATSRTADVKAGNGAENATIYRTTLNDGTGIDYVMVAADTVKALIEQGDNADYIVVSIDNDEENPAGEFAFEVSSDTVSTLAHSGLGVTLESPAGTVTLSSETLRQAAQSGFSLYFRIVPVSDEADDARNAFFSDSAIFSLSNVTGQVFGTPRMIQTNMESFATTVTLPLEGLTKEQLADEEFLKSLCVYVEHDDGTTELVYGTLVYTDDIPTGITFDISKFSRFQIVSVNKTGASSQWGLIACLAGGIMLILLIILLLILNRRRRRSQVQL